MNRKGGLGEILVSYPSFILVLIITVLFIIFSNIISVGNNVVISEPVNNNYFENVFIEEFPPTNSLLDSFIYSEVNVGGVLYKVKDTFSYLCNQVNGQYYAIDFKDLIYQKFRVYSNNGLNKFALASYSEESASYIVLVSNGNFEGDVSKVEFDNVFYGADSDYGCSISGATFKIYVKGVQNV